MKKPGKPRPYLTPNEVAQLLMVSPVTVRQWAQKGQLHALNTPGGHRRFTHREVDRFARERGINLPPSDDEVLRILIVDDDEHLARYLAELLRGFAEKVTSETAHDGFEAGQKVQTFRPHIVLLDLMMPGVDGFEVCRLLKSEAATKGIRVIAMTGYHSQENVDRILAAGAEACLSKPIETAALLDVIGVTSDLETAG